MNAQNSQKTEITTQLKYGVLLLVSLSASAAMAANLNVNNTDPACNTPGAPFCTIGGALNSALSGDTVTVAPGTYFGNIEVNTSNLTIVGVNVPAIHGAVSISATGVKFEGFEVTGEPITIMGNDNMVLRNRVHDFTGIRAGIVVGRFLRVAHNVVASNSISGGISGIEVNGDRNKVVRNRVTDIQGGDGIVVSGNNNVLKKNQVRDCFCNHGFGIAGSRNALTANQAINNALDGFGILPSASGGFSRKNRLSSNVAIGNGAFGFNDIFGPRNTYRRNRCNRRHFRSP